MPIYVRCGMQALYHGREQAKLLGMARVEELLKVRGQAVQHHEALFSTQPDRSS